MKKIPLILSLIFALSTGFLLAQDKIKLVDLELEDAEYGTHEVQKDLFPDIQSGPGQVNNGPFHGGNAFWSENRKVVKEVQPGLEVDAESYRSWMPDIFVVGGEKMAGVGLWAKFFGAYHWIEYKIPEGAKKFKAVVYQTDDPFGYYIHSDPQLVEFSFKVLIDGEEAYQTGKRQEGLVRGSGGVMDELEIDIPAGAKTIRFVIENNEGIDWNRNNELVMSDAYFEK